MKKRLITIALAISIATLALVGCGKGNDNKDTADNSNKNNVESTEGKKADDTKDVEKLKELKNEHTMLLANKENPLGENYVPENLVTSEIPFQEIIVTRQLEKEVAAAAKEMFDAARKDGVNLLGASGYRSYNIQVDLYNRNVEQLGAEKAAQLVAKPGTSEHQTGMALDILSEENQNMDESFDTSESFQWLINNCYKYGFILRYPKGKEAITGYAYEPWHYRYIGHKDIAEEIMKNNMTFEEYLEKLNGEIEQHKAS